MADFYTKDAAVAVDNSNERVGNQMIERPTKPGYVFVHWSKVNPGEYETLTGTDGEEIKILKECPPFDFNKEVITSDLKLYAVFIPERKIEFMVDGNTVMTETTLFGGRAYNPTPSYVKSKVEAGLDDVEICHHNPLPKPRIRG